jgi:hypothetical protein
MSNKQNDFYNECESEAREEMLLKRDEADKERITDETTSPMEELIRALKDNLENLKIISKALDTIQAQQEAMKRIEEANTQLKGFINKFEYYERHGSPTLPKNSSIDVTTDFKN